MKYVTRARPVKPKMDEEDRWWDTPPETARSIHEDDLDTFTGLYNANGQELHRVKAPLGFCRD